MSDPSAAERKRLRREMRAQRRALTTRQRRDAAASLHRTLFSLPRIRHARNLAMYLPVQGEVSLEPAIERAWSLNIPVYLPCLRGRSLEFRRYRPDSMLTENRFGIPEPVRGENERLNARFLDVVLAPLVAFDSHGERLGTGGGYYDRTFAFLRHRTCWQRPTLIGVAYAFQQVAKLPAAAWDIPMQGVVTDVGTHMFATNRRVECSTG